MCVSVLPSSSPLIKSFVWIPKALVGCGMFQELSPLLGNEKLTTSLLMLQTWDSKGHHMVASGDGTYCHCALCFASRRARDMKFVASHICTAREEIPCREGDYKKGRGSFDALIPANVEEDSM